MAKYHFVIVGSGWRSLYYVRIAKALPDIFCLDAMYCRTEEKAELMASKYDIPTSTSIEECMGYKPDFVVVVVNKASIADVSIEWMNRGMTVLCETPASLDEAMLDKLWEEHKKGGKLVVAEQYTRYPSHRAKLSVLSRELLGDVSCMNISLAHEYHGASLMRAYMGIDAGEKYTVSGKTYEFPTVETLTRYDSFTDGRVANKKRTVATFTFESGKVAFYDFDSEQYRSPIRKNTVKLQGTRGELIDDKIYYLDDDNKGQVGEFETCVRVTETCDENPNLHYVTEVTGISYCGENVYEPVFGVCELPEDETAIATLMAGTAEYSRGGECPYPLRDALSDAYMAILLGRAVNGGSTVESEKKVWMR